MGALRFKLEEDGEFLGTHEKEVPPMVFLGKLENASFIKYFLMNLL